MSDEKRKRFVVRFRGELLRDDRGELLVWDTAPQPRHEWATYDIDFIAAHLGDGATSEELVVEEL